MNSKPLERRYLALWFPYLPADRLCRLEDMRRRRLPGGTCPNPEPRNPPRVFIEKIKSALRLVAVDRAALTLGLSPGLALADARARVPELDAVEIDHAADAAFLARLADACDRYTPLVSLDAPDGLMLDITGCAHLFGGDGPMREDLLKRLAAAGIDACASIAGTPDTARALARFGGAAVIPHGEEAEAVKPLPVAALGIAPEVVTGLSRAGLKIIGELAGRPRQPLAARFGAELVDRLARTLGERDIRITPRRAMPVCMAERRFAEPITRDEDVLGALSKLAVQIAPVLEARGEGGRRFEASLFRVDGEVARVTVETGRPQRNPQMLARLFQHRFEALAAPPDPGYGFDLVRLTVVACDRLDPAPVDLDSRVMEEEEVGALVDRLATRFGVDAVRRFVPVDSHLPERAARAMPAVASGKDVGKDVGRDAGWQETDVPRPIHMFDPPLLIEALAEVPDGPPLKFRWRRILHEIARAEGPERIAAEWWHHDGMTRDYYRVEDDAGHRYWVFREGLFGTEAQSPRWYLHGIFP